MSLYVTAGGEVYRDPGGGWPAVRADGDLRLLRVTEAELDWLMLLPMTNPIRRKMWLGEVILEIVEDPSYYPWD